MSRLAPLVVPLAALAAAVPPVFVCAQELPRGTVIEHVTCRADSQQSYALYVPSSYRADRPAPVVYAFDAMAKGVTPVRRFADAAERLGFVVAGSNNSKNGPVPASEVALNAMVADVRSRLATDPRRVYFTGFSGGARLATLIGIAMRGEAAGVMGFGAGFPDGVSPAPSMRFSYFAGAGFDDFNFPELSALDRTLDRVGLPHRIEVYEGGHEWPSPEICGRALEWMLVRELKSGLQAPDTALVDRLFTRALADAAGEAGAGRYYVAWSRYAAAAQDFEGLADVSRAADEARRLLQRSEVARMAADLKAADQRQAALTTRVEGLVRDVATSEDYITPAQELRAVLLDMRKHKDVVGRPVERMVAQRVLFTLWMSLNQAAARLLDGGNVAAAAVLLQAMTDVRPENARAEYALARALARLGSRKDAIKSLQRAVAKGFADVAALEAETDFGPLRADRMFRDIVDGLKRRPA
jgi:dienelactone hydrolase